MSEYLPQEVLAEIFLRLPIKSIIQCTSVCKSWYDFITSPSFISAHLNNQHEHLLVRYVDPEKEKDSIYCDNNPIKEIYALYNDNENFDQYIQFSDVPPKYPSHHFNIVGSCNGLLCLSDDLYNYPDIYYLWNPSIRKYVQLPKPIFTFWTHGAFDHTLGFGFDPLTNDYKVVRIVDLHDGCKRVPPRVELYKLSTGVWQDISHVAPPYQFFERIPGVYVNGACHWVAQDKIVLFDVQKETFRLMMLPDNLFYGWCSANWFDLFVSEDSLCLANRLRDDNKTIDIWRMKEYGDPNSWVKQFSVSSRITFNVSVVDEFYSRYYGGRERQESHFLVKPIGARRNGEILWRADNGVLVSYDIAVEKIKNLGIRNANVLLYQFALYVNTYKVSLMLLDKRVDYFARDTDEESSKERNKAAHHNTEEEVSG